MCSKIKVWTIDMYKDSIYTLTATALVPATETTCARPSIVFECTLQHSASSIHQLYEVTRSFDTGVVVRGGPRGVARARWTI